MSDDAYRREVLPGPGGRLHDGAPPGVPAEEAARAELQRRLEAVTRVVLRPLASPLPLAFLALAAATLLTSGLQLGWLLQTSSDASPLAPRARRAQTAVTERPCAGRRARASRHAASPAISSTQPGH